MTARERKQAFVEWLAKGAAETELQRREIINMLEHTLVWFIQEKIDPEFESLYFVERPEVVHNLWQRIQTDTVLKLENAQRSPVSYTEVLHLYEAYLRAPSGKKPEAPAAATKMLTEGEIQELHITKHERNPQLRAQCIELQGWRCKACGLDFTEIYGDLGREFIEVHHIVPISQTDGDHAVDPAKDLVPLCSNCHSMIHRLMPLLAEDADPVEELRKRLIVNHPMQNEDSRTNT